MSKNKIDDLLKQLSKIDETGAIISESPYAVTDHYIPTGNYLLNAQISGSLFGGIPNDTTTVVAGESGTGKTFLALNICREAQKMGYDLIIYGDTEQAIKLETAKKFGIDTSPAGGFRLSEFKTVKEVRHKFANMCAAFKVWKEKNPNFKALVILDSLGNLTTDKERNDAVEGSDKADMTRSRDIKALFRMATADFGELGIPFIVTNHTYTDLGSFIPSQKVSGGSGVFYAASTILRLSKAQLKDESEDSKRVGLTKTGIIVTSHVEKSRFTRPIPVKFHISFITGMNPFVGLENYISWDSCGVERGKIEVDKNTGEISFTGNAAGRTIAVEHLRRNIYPKELFSHDVFNEDTLKKLDNKVKEIFLLPEQDTNGTELVALLGLEETGE